MVWKPFSYTLGKLWIRKERKTKYKNTLFKRANFEIRIERDFELNVSIVYLDCFNQYNSVVLTSY